MRLILVMPEYHVAQYLGTVVVILVAVLHEGETVHVAHVGLPIGPEANKWYLLPCDTRLRLHLWPTADASVPITINGKQAEKGIERQNQRHNTKRHTHLRKVCRISIKLLFFFF